jgi:hypothetical protein
LTATTVDTGLGLIDIEMHDPLQMLKWYFEAVWEVGGVLQSEGMLPLLKFDAEELRSLLNHLDCKVGREQARGIYLEARRFPNEVLNFAGSLSGLQFYELIESHHAARPE